jgi:hypothetical protein
MGLFDYVNFKMKCPKCKRIIDGFQSKDGPCLMYTLEFWDVEHFYAQCLNEDCRAWIEFTLKRSEKGHRPNRKLTLRDYSKKFEFPTKEENEKRKRDIKALFTNIK